LFFLCALADRTSIGGIICTNQDVLHVECDSQNNYKALLIKSTTNRSSLVLSDDDVFNYGDVIFERIDLIIHSREFYIEKGNMELNYSSISLYNTLIVDGNLTLIRSNMILKPAARVNIGACFNARKNCSLGVNITTSDERQLSWSDSFVEYITYKCIDDRNITIVNRCTGGVQTVGDISNEGISLIFLQSLKCTDSSSEGILAMVILFIFVALVTVINCYGISLYLRPLIFVGDVPKEYFMKK